MSNQSISKRISPSIMVLAACIFGVAIGLFGLNFWHVSKCANNKTSSEIENYIEALNRRLLQAESLLYQNELILNKVMTVVQSRLAKIEESEIEEIKKISQEEAVRISLALKNYPVPAIPDFEMDDKYYDAETLADLVDDVYSKIGKSEENQGDFGSTYAQFADDYENDVNRDVKSKPSISDAEALEQCNKWKDEYKVSVGVSWGDLPHDLQQKWLEYSCDYHLV